MVRDHLTDVERDIPRPGTRDLIGLAGTVTSVAAMEQGLPKYDRERIHHFHLTREAAEEVFRTLAPESADQRVHIRDSTRTGRRHRRRRDPGLTMMRAFEFDEMLVSEDDILDGIVRASRRE